MAWSRAWMVWIVATLSVACGSRLPPYRGALPPPLPRTRERASATTVPAPPSDTLLDLRSVTSVGVRLEYDGHEEGPNGASQPFDVTYYYASQGPFFAALREALRGRSVAVGEANGSEDLLVTVVLRTMRVEHEECTTVSRQRRVCSGFGSGRTCDWEDDDREECSWPISLQADVLTSRGDASGPVLRLSARAASRSGLSNGLRELHQALAQDLASLLRAGGLP